MEHNKQEQQDLQGGIHLVMFLIASVTRTVTLYSREPGSTGPWFFGVISWIGFGIQGYYVSANVHASGLADLIPYSVVFSINVTWLVVHFVRRRIHLYRGMRFHSYEPGVGIFYRWFPKWKPCHVNLLSDIVTAANIGGVCFILSSPILGTWYMAMIVWLLIEHSFLFARDSLQMQRLEDSQLDSQMWSDHMKEHRR